MSITSLRSDRLSLRTAKLFLAAFDQSSIDIWCHALRSAEAEGVDFSQPAEALLEKTIERLRKAWYHGGNLADRQKVHEIAAGLRFLIQETEKPS